MRQNLILKIAFTFLGGICAPLYASEIAGSSYTVSQIDATDFQYDLTLSDIGTTNIGTFWFSWVPGEDFMSTAPTNILSPASWTSLVTHTGPGDGFAIQWVAGVGAALAPGRSLIGFDFVSTMTPAQMAGSSQFYSNVPVTTGFVYAGAPLSDAGFLFTATAATQSAPEPSSLWLMIAPCALLMLAIRRRYPGSVLFISFSALQTGPS